MIEEPFASGDSILHRTDPRLRVAAAAVFSFTVAAANHPATLGAALAAALTAAVAAEIADRRLLARLKPVFGFLALLWLLLPWTLPGATLWRVGPLVATQPGIALAATITMKSITILIAFSALVATMDTAALGQALYRLGVPAGAVHLLLLTYRYLFVIEQEYRRLRRAADIRNFRPKTDTHTYRTCGYLVGMVFVRAHQRARRVHQAMVCRGFDGRFRLLRTTESLAGRRRFAALAVLVVAVLAGIEWGGVV